MSQFQKWRMTPTALFRLTLALVIAVAYAYQSRAQEVDATEDIEEIATDEVSLPSQSVQAALDSINARNPDSPIKQMQAVVLLKRMGAYAEAKPFLDQAMSADIDEVAKVELHEAIGTAELVRLSVDTNLPEARDFIFSLFESVRTAKRNPVRLLEYVKGLADEDKDAQREAMANLAEAEAYAIPSLVNAVRSQDLNVPLQSIEAAIARVGDNAEEPLLAMLGAPDPMLQGIAARALGRLQSKRALLHLIRPYFIGQGDVRQSAAAVFQQLGSAPSNVYDSVALLTRRAKHHLDGNTPVKPDVDGNIEMWTWSAEQNNVVPHTLRAKQAGAVVAARFARDAYELNPTFETNRMLLVTRLEVDQSIGGLDELLPKGIGTAHQLGSAQGVLAACQALEYSLDHGLDAAAIGACEIVSQLCPRGASSANWSPLVRALQHPNRRVRHAAVRSIIKIDPRQRYDGASFFMEAILDLANASGSPSAVVGMPRRDASDSVSGLLSNLGFSVAQTNEGRPLLKMATASSDYDVIFVSDSVSLPTAGETIQQLRKHPHTKNVPIVLMARKGGLERAERIAYVDDMTTVLPEFADEDAVIGALTHAEALVEGISVSPARRMLQAQDALAWLTHLAQYSQTYPWYDLQRTEQVALQAASHPALSQAAVSLLGYLGGEKAQKQLIEMASQKNNSMADRQRAANAFTEAVVRRGLMLRSTDVYRQYDRYNASEKEEVAYQEVLGQILDVIESQTQPTSMNQTSF